MLVAAFLGVDAIGTAGFKVTVPEGFAVVPGYIGHGQTEAAGTVDAGGLWLRSDDSALIIDPVDMKRGIDTVSDKTCDRLAQVAARVAARDGSAELRYSRVVDSPWGRACERHLVWKAPRGRGVVERLEFLLPFTTERWLRFRCWAPRGVATTFSACRSALQSLDRVEQTKK
jgi:hypothetical protein